MWGHRATRSCPERAVRVDSSRRVSAPSASRPSAVQSRRTSNDIHTSCRVGDRPVSSAAPWCRRPQLRRRPPWPRPPHRQLREVLIPDAPDPPRDVDQDLPEQAASFRPSRPSRPCDHTDDKCLHKPSCPWAERPDEHSGLDQAPPVGCPESLWHTGSIEVRIRNQAGASRRRGGTRWRRKP